MPKPTMSMLLFLLYNIAVAASYRASSDVHANTESQYYNTANHKAKVAIEQAQRWLMQSLSHEDHSAELIVDQAHCHRSVIR